MEMFENLEEEKKKRIINASLAEFSRKGFKDSSTNVIVSEAGISKGALFHYFGSKENLYQYLLTYSSEMIKKKVLENLPETDDLIELIRFLTKRKAILTSTYPLMFEFYYSILRERPDDPTFQQLVSQSMEIINRLISEQIDMSKFRDGISLEQVVEVCVWVSEGFARKYAQIHPQLEVDTMLQSAEELFDTLRVMLYKEEHV